MTSLNDYGHQRRTLVHCGPSVQKTSAEPLFLRLGSSLNEFFCDSCLTTPSKKIPSGKKQLTAKLVRCDRERVFLRRRFFFFFFPGVFSLYFIFNRPLGCAHFRTGSSLIGAERRWWVRLLFGRDYWNAPTRRKLLVYAWTGRTLSRERERTWNSSGTWCLFFPNFYYTPFSNLCLSPVKYILHVNSSFFTLIACANCRALLSCKSYIEKWCHV